VTLKTAIMLKIQLYQHQYKLYLKKNIYNDRKQYAMVIGFFIVVKNV